MPHLHSRMRRITGKDEKPPLDQDDEPDLYQISELFPVPPLQDSRKPSARAAASPEVPPVGLCTSPSIGTLGRSTHRLQGYQTSSVREAPVSLLNLAEIVDRHAGAPLDRRASAATRNHSFDVQGQQSCAPQQGLSQLSSALTSMPIASFSLPPYAQAVTSVPQQFQQQCDVGLLSYMMQCIARGSGATLEQPRASASKFSGEAPIMYIPVYPSTLASLGTGTASSSDSRGTNATLLQYFHGL